MNARTFLSHRLIGASAIAINLAAAISPIMAGAASAQEAPAIRTPAYAGQGGQNGQGGQPAYAPPATGDYRNPPPEPAAPAGYDGRSLPPPPADYVPAGDPNTLRAADERYAIGAERWARDNCVKSRGDAGAGAVVGGILGAIIGGGLAGRHDQGAGVVAGAAVGAIGGAAVASSSNGETSPGCPPGYVVRRGAVVYSDVPPGYYYAAPEWYRPWVFVGGYWSYRPYPYHDWYYRTYRAPVRGYYGRPYGGGHGGWGHRR